MNDDERAIAGVLAAYQDALNAGDIDAAMALYAPDAVFMPQNSPSSVGIDAVRAAYVKVFAALKCDVVFTVAEIRTFTPEWAFARTNSAGTTTHPDGTVGNEGNQELYVLQRLAAGWKIARYCFATTNPVPA